MAYEFRNPDLVSCHGGLLAGGGREDLLENPAVLAGADVHGSRT